MEVVKKLKAKAKKVVRGIVACCEDFADYKPCPHPDKVIADNNTKLIVNRHDFGKVLWVESNLLADSFIIHCENGDYEL